MEYDFNNAFANGWSAVQGVRDNRTKALAGRALAWGDYGGARNAFAQGGMVNEAVNVDKYDREVKSAEREEAAAAKAERAKWMLQAANGLMKVPPAQRTQAYQEHIAPVLKAMGVGDDVLSQVTSLSDQDLEGFIVALGGQVEKQKGSWKEIKNADGSSRYEWFEDSPLAGTEPATPEITPAATAGAPGEIDRDGLFNALIQQESGGRAGVLGPQTRYGQAQGMTQMLPATAQSMAQKLGMPWRPELMTAKTEEAAEYQRTLGRAYFEEGLEKHGGDPRKALMYYHGGPNQDLWGPKTRGYADQVLSRVSNFEPYEVAALGATPPPPSGRPTRPGSAAPKPEWRRATPEEASTLGAGQWQINDRTGQVQQISGTAPKEQQEKPPTEAQVKSSEFAYRMLRANDQMNVLAEQGIVKPTALEIVVGKDNTRRLVFNNQNDRRFVSAAKTWLAPVLRRDTGAAVTDEEFLFYADMFIPMPGDGPDLLKQKAQARHDTMYAMARSGGSLFEKTYGHEEFNVRFAPEPKRGASTLPAEAAKRLSPGHDTTFSNGQTWTLRDGKPVRVK